MGLGAERDQGLFGHLLVLGQSKTEGCFSVLAQRFEVRAQFDEDRHDLRTIKDGGMMQGGHPENVARVDESRVPPGIPLKQMLTETHDALFVPPKEKTD